MGNIFQEKVSWNTPNQSTIVQIFQVSRNTFNVQVQNIKFSANHSTLLKYIVNRNYKSLNVLQIIQRFGNLETIVRDL